DDDDDDDGDDEPAKPVKDAAVARAARRGGRGAKKKPLPAPPVERGASAKGAKPAASNDGGGSSNTFIAAALALAVGGAIGWFAHGARADQGDDASATPDPAAVATGTAGAGGVCDTWAEKLCAEAGAQSEGCGQARAASGLLPAGACDVAMANLPATMEKLKAARSSCDELVTKICNDLGKGTETCKMVTEKTPQFPTERCKAMLGQYDEVLKELKQMESRNAPLSAELAAEHAKGDRPG